MDENSNSNDGGSIESSNEDPQDMRRELVTSFTDFEKGFRKDYPALWWLSLLGPAGITAAILLGVGLVYAGGWALSGKLVLHAFITFFALGRFVICYPAFISASGDGEKATILPEWMGGLEEYLDFTPMNLFWLVTYMDFMVALFVTFHMGLLFRIPWVGPKIAMLVWDGKFVMDSQPWIKKVAFGGLIAFVIFPTSTTGSIGGSIFGRLLGLSRVFTVFGVLIGSILGNGVMVLFSDFITLYVKDSIWLKVAGVVILIVAMVFLERRYRAAKSRYLESEGIDEDAAIDDP
jgi:hypothetical protein